MALSFVFGVMSLTWMAGLTAFLVLEKATSAGPWLGRLGGALLLDGGARRVTPPPTPLLGGRISCWSR
jgi:predicted metal-binding membrane protein